MESAEPFPQGAVKAPELAELLAHAGLFVSVYLHTDPDVAKAAQRSELRWKSVRSDLEAKGVPGPAIERIEVEVADAHTRGRMLGTVVDADARAHIEHGDPFGPQDFGRAHSVPYVVPMIRWRQASPPVVVVLIDRVGADVFAITRDRQESREIQGTDTPIHKVHAGGWSMRRYQER